MARYRVTLPTAQWPANIRERLEAALSGMSTHQRRRLTAAMGRWIKAARDEGVSPELVTMQLWRMRTTGLAQTGRGAVRQALAAVFPAAGAELFAGAPRKPVRCKREKLGQLIERHLPRWPADWRARAEPKLTVDPDGLNDGLLVQAWSPDTIEGRIMYLSTHFKFCRSRGLPTDGSPIGSCSTMRAVGR